MKMAGLNPANFAPESSYQMLRTVEAVLKGFPLQVFSVRFHQVLNASAASEVAMASYDSDKVAHIHEELHSHLPSEPALRVKALESLLVEKGLLKTDAVDKWLDNFAEKIGPKNGARVIARSWVTPEFESTLRNDAMKAFKDLGLAEGGGYELKAVFNSDTVHNLVVCTLCSTEFRLSVSSAHRAPAASPESGC